LSADELMQAIATEFGLNVKGESRRETIAAISQFLLRQIEYGKETVLIIDEAQNLTEDLLEQVRLISNIETDDRKLLQIVLMGQPELRDRLNSPRLKQLRQRITVRFHLAPLTRIEVAQYIQHRLKVSGAQGALNFTMPAVWRIFNYSGGIPRLVNAVCDKALLAGFVQRRVKVNYAMVGRAIRELEGNFYS
jgi:general secretion pathway protein A